MKRPSLLTLPTPQPPAGNALSGLFAWAREAALALRAVSERLAEHAAAIKQLYEGQTGVAGSVTLTDSTTTTAVSNALIPAGAKILLTPATADAAAEWAAGGLYVSAVAKGSFTITHSSDTSARTFYWAALAPG